MSKNYKLDVVCDVCSKSFNVYRSTLYAYRKRNKTDGYVCLSCKNKSRSKPPIKTAVCEQCGGEWEVSRKSKPSKLCVECRKPKREPKIRRSREEINEQISQSVKKAWRTNRQAFMAGLKKKYEDKEYAVRISEHLTRVNKDPENIEKRKKKYQQTLSTTDLRERISERSKRLWQSQKFRDSVIDGMMRPEVRARMAQGRENQPRISSLETSLSKILSDLGVVFSSNIKIAFYHWDFLVERDGEKDLLIEVNGDYWHRRVLHVVKNDKAKRTYFERHLSDQYELRYLWEHEFLCVDKVADKVRHWLGLVEEVQFQLNQVETREIDRSESFPFLSAYHYLKPKNGLSIGAFLDNKLIAVAVFCPPTRLESAASVGLEYNSVYELARFCICPGYGRRNFASWFLARSRKFVYDCTDKVAIIAFSDKAMNHSGTIYVADNWTRCEDVPSDYWYLDKEGYYMHKRTLYGHAVRMGMKEAEFAREYKYLKVKGMGKSKFIHRA